MRSTKASSGFDVFLKMCYEEHLTKNKDPDLSELRQKVASKWTTMTSVQKKSFDELAQKEQGRSGRVATLSNVAKAAAASPSGRQRRTPKKAMKDPKAPKHAMTSFFFFTQEKRPELQKTHPDWKITEVGKELGRMWREDVSDQEKQRYIEMANVDKKRYQDEFEQYKNPNAVPKKSSISPTVAVASGSASASDSHVETGSAECGEEKEETEECEIEDSVQNENEDSE